ncbi:hypothetical protein NM688_g4482 [Phlebia brevispora]|uniref:Uncharacterized protein n=1 Tax=Phlebia brevispora TaxID=194682 RepID=A0ACC1T2V1_9APHY|nr:hypothetical protein NM688_g4482 [Phlebia brevispora]
MADLIDTGPMTEIIPNLWLGALQNAANANLLRSKNIHSILSVMKGKFTIAETFKRYQIQLDDTEEEDVLKHLVAAITFIQSELDQNRGVLVHCLAGVSRSATIVAAYLMYAKGLDPTTALDLIRAARPYVDPNSNFLHQLEIFYQASCKVSKHDKGVRMFYLDRTVKEIMNGDGSVDSTMFPNYPRTPSVSAPTTPGGPRRRIRCKMCRTELASREHMLDHGQLSSPNPAVSYSPTVPSPPEFPHVRRPSEPSSPQSPNEEEEAKLTPAEVDEAAELGRQMSRSMSLVSEKDGENVKQDEIQSSSDRDVDNCQLADSSATSTTIPLDAGSPVSSLRIPHPAQPGFVHPSDLTAQIMANPKLAALRGLSVIPQASPSLLSPSGSRVAYSPPILANPKCSGYFVEPMKWMEPFLEQGQLAGKIVCPNKKCNAKLGNYDWAGVCCSCKEWVVPGFCIHRSKVDEII